MKTSQEKLMIAMQLIKAQSDLLALHYKLDCNVYSDKQMKRFDRLEEARDEAIKNLENSLCTCDDYGFIGEHYCPIHIIKEK